jgi:hypothetical protein
MAKIKYPTQAELLTIIARTEFKPFTKADWYTFSGCESDNPYIGYYNDFTIVIDGHLINIVHSEDEYGGELFGMTQLA